MKHWFESNTYIMRYKPCECNATMNYIAMNCDNATTHIFATGSPNVIPFCVLQKSAHWY